MGSFWFVLIIFSILNVVLLNGYRNDCQHYYDQPIGVCWSMNSTKGLRSYIMLCEQELRNDQNKTFIKLYAYNDTDSCDSNEGNEITTNGTKILRDLTDSGDIVNGTNINPYFSCSGNKACPYFHGRYYLTHIITDAPSRAPTTDPTAAPTINPTEVPTRSPSNITDAPTRSPSVSPTEPTIEPTIDPTLEPTMNPVIVNYTFTPSLSPTPNMTTLSPTIDNKTCARTQYNNYYQDILYVIDTCLKYDINDTFPYDLVVNKTSIFNYNNKNLSTYLRYTCHQNKYEEYTHISGDLFLNETCNNTIVDGSNTTIYNNEQCYNYTSIYDSEDLHNIRWIEGDNDGRDVYKLFLLNCDYLIDGIIYPSAYKLYLVDIYGSVGCVCFTSLMLLLYLYYITNACIKTRSLMKRRDRASSKSQAALLKNSKKDNKETGWLILDDNFSSGRLALIIFQFLCLLCLWLNTVLNFLNSWSYVTDEIRCHLMMSALDLTWHWGKGFLYMSLMTRITIIIDGSGYIIPAKITKVYAFIIISYFLLTPIFDLIESRADHSLYTFLDSSDNIQYVCSEQMELWISFILLFGDLLLCSITIGIYLYFVGEMIMYPTENQKLIDMCIRYALFTLIAAIFIMISNGIWSTNSKSIGRYCDNVFIVIALFFMFSFCTGCYKQFFEGIHKRMRKSYIDRFLIKKESLIEAEFEHRRLNPKLALRSHDKSFNNKLTMILSPKSLAAKHDIDELQKQQAEYNKLVNTPKGKLSRKERKKLKKKIKKLQEKKKLLFGKTDGDDSQGVGMNERELTTLQNLLTFNNTKDIKSSGAGGASLHDDIASANTNNDSNSNSIMLKSGLSRKKKKKGLNLLTDLHDNNSHLPKQLTLAIHASVMDTVHAEEKQKELSDAQKIDIRIDELFKRVETYWDENLIIFPNRSPTLFAGYAHKITHTEQADINKRRKDVEQDRQELSVDYSESYDSDEAFQVESSWPKPSRKYGQEQTLQDIFKELQDIHPKDLLSLWDYFDIDKKKQIDYKETLTKLLGSLFLLYYRRTNSTDILKDRPPKYAEIEPLLQMLAKYIRDSLRKQKKKFLFKKDFKTNFISLYLKAAIDKRTKLLKNRKKKLFGYDDLDDQSITGNNPLFTPMQGFNVLDDDFENKYEEKDDIKLSIINDDVESNINDDDIDNLMSIMDDLDEEEKAKEKRKQKRKQKRAKKNYEQLQKMNKRRSSKKQKYYDITAEEMEEMRKNYTYRDSGTNKFILDYLIEDDDDDVLSQYKPPRISHGNKKLGKHKGAHSAQLNVKTIALKTPVSKHTIAASATIGTTGTLRDDDIDLFMDMAMNIDPDTPVDTKQVITPMHDGININSVDLNSVDLDGIDIDDFDVDVDDINLDDDDDDDNDVGNTQITTNVTSKGSSLQFDVDALITSLPTEHFNDLMGFDVDKIDYNNDDNDDNNNKEHVKDQDGTTILNDQIQDLPKKVVTIIDDNKGKHNQYESLQLNDDLMDMAVGLVNDDDDDDNNTNISKVHITTDTEIINDGNNDATPQPDATPLAFDQMMDDVLDVTFAIDDSDDD